MLRAVGFKDEDFKKPQVAVASSPSDMTPCNVHLGELSEHARVGIDQAGGKAVSFNTITVKSYLVCCLLSSSRLRMEFLWVPRECDILWSAAM